MSKHQVINIDEKKNTIIFTSYPVTYEKGYVTPYEERLSAQEKYCSANGFNVVKVVNLPRFQDELDNWLLDLKELILNSGIFYVVIDTMDFFCQWFDLSMLYSILEPYGVQVIDECTYLDNDEWTILFEDPDVVLVTLMNKPNDMTKTMDLVACRYQWEMQKSLLLTLAMKENYAIDPLVFVAINDPATWEDFFMLLDTYIQVRDIENIIIQADGLNRVFAKELIQFFNEKDVNIMVSEPSLKQI